MLMPVIQIKRRLISICISVCVCYGVIAGYRDFVRWIESNRKEREFSWDAYHDIDDINGYLTNMSQTYPNMTELLVGGESYEGRRLLGLRINNPKGSQKKHTIIIESGIHGNEWIAPASATYFINQLLKASNPDIISLRDTLDWHIFPCINPDGYHYSFTVERKWRKTRSKSAGSKCYGVDANRNWPYNWKEKKRASNNSCDTLYAGPEPFSEKETRTFAEYIKNVKNLSGYVSLHAVGPMVLIPYADSKEHRDNYADMVIIANTSISYANKVNPHKYKKPGTCAENMYGATGCSNDWVKSKFGTKIVVLYELADTPPEKISKTGDEVTQLLLGFVVGARKLGYLN